MAGCTFENERKNKELRGKRKNSPLHVHNAIFAACKKPEIVRQEHSVKGSNASRKRKTFAGLGLLGT
jgi:hypothetical protein